MAVYDPPQLSEERHSLLSASQALALALLQDGASGAALHALRAGTWPNPEEELRQLLICVQQECERLDGGDNANKEEQAAR